MIEKFVFDKCECLNGIKFCCLAMRVESVGDDRGRKDVILNKVDEVPGVAMVKLEDANLWHSVGRGG